MYMGTQWSSDKQPEKRQRGLDQEGENLYGLCDGCHNLLHTNETWVKDKDNPIWGHHSTDEWKAKLRSGYELLNQRGILDSYEDE
jgi:hypothetical protein